MTLDNYKMLKQLANDINKMLLIPEAKFVIRLNGEDHELKDIVSLINIGTLAPKIVLIAE